MQVGDIRYLNSGSPAMTVVEIENGKATFVWIQGTGYGKLKVNVDDVEKMTYAGKVVEA